MGTTLLILGTVLGGLGGVSALITAFFTRRKDNADRFDRYTDRIEKRLITLEARVVVEVEARLSSERRVAQLETALLAAGLPVPPDIFAGEFRTETSRNDS